MKWIISLLFSFIAFTVKPQSQTVNNLFSKDSLRFFIARENVQLIFKNSIITKVGNNFISTPLKIDQKENFDQELNQNQFQVVSDDEKVYFVRKNLGEVFLLTDNSIIRIDRSSNIFSNSGSKKYLYKNEIHSFFGYGFFDATNITVSFSEESQQWARIFHPLDSDIPNPRVKPFSNKIENLVYFFNGVDQGKRISDFFMYDFLNQTFSLIGQVNPNFPYNNIGLESEQLQLNLFNKIYGFDNHLLLIDYKNFTYSIIDRISALDLSIAGGHIIGDKIYYLKPFGEDEFFVEEIDSSFIKTLFVDYYPILTPVLFSENSIILLAVFIFLISLIIILYRFQKLRKLKNNYVLKQSLYLTYKNELLILSPTESEVLDYLLQHNKCQLSELYSLKIFGEYSDFYKKQLVSKSVEELQEKVKNSVLISEKIKIEKKQSTVDKRSIDFILEGKIMFYSGWLQFVLNL